MDDNKELQKAEKKNESIRDRIFSNNSRLIVGLFTGIIIGWLVIPYISNQIIEKYEFAFSVLGGLLIFVIAIYVIVIWNVHRIQKYFFGEEIEVSQLKKEMNDFTTGISKGLIDKYFPPEEILKKEAAKKIAPKVGNYFVWSFLRGWGYRQITTLFGILLTFLAVIVAIQQNKLVEGQNLLFKNQNELVELQNQQIRQQTNLQEAERRSSLVFLMSNIMDQVDKELRDTSNVNNNKREISPQTIGRIAALSNSLKPYFYLENGELIEKPYSPERGHLLLALSAIKLDYNSYEELFLTSNFSYSDLRETRLVGSTLVSGNFNFSDFSNSDLMESSLHGSLLNHVNFNNCQLNGCDFSFSFLENATFKNSNIVQSSFSGAGLSKTNFENADLRFSEFLDYKIDNCNFTNAKLHGVKINPFSDWFDRLEQYGCIGIPKLKEEYFIDTTTQVHKNGGHFFVVKKKKETRDDYFLQAKIDRDRSIIYIPTEHQDRIDELNKQFWIQQQQNNGN